MANIQVTWITHRVVQSGFYSRTRDSISRLLVGWFEIHEYVFMLQSRPTGSIAFAVATKKMRSKGLGLMHASLQPTLFVCQYVSQLVVRPSMSHFAFLGTQWWFLHHCHASLVDSTNLCVSQSVRHILLFTWFFWYHCSCSNGLLTISIVPAHAEYLTYMGSGPKGDDVL